MRHQDLERLKDVSNVEPGGLVSIISITDSRHEAVSSSTKVYPPRCSQLHKLSSWFPVPSVVRGKLTGEGGVALSGGGVGGCRAPPIRREQGRDFPGKAVAENPPSRAGDVGSIPHAWILCATTKA